METEWAGVGRGDGWRVAGGEWGAGSGKFSKQSLASLAPGNAAQ